MQRYEHGGNIYQGEHIALDFSVNTNALGMPDQVREALEHAISKFALYPDTECTQLGQQLSQHLNIPQDQILFGNGASDLIFRICAALRPKVVLTLAPTFSEYERPAKLFGAEIREHRLLEEHDFLLTDAILDDIKDDVDLIFLCNPNNPTGRLVPEPVMDQIMKTCKRTGAQLVIDECFMDFTSGKSRIGHIADFPNLLILRAFTKLYSLAGLRLGYLLGDAQTLKKIRPYGPEWAVSVPAQLAGVAALSAEPAWSSQTRESTQSQRERLRRMLLDLGLEVCPSDTNYLLVKSKIPLIRMLRQRGILVRPCDNFTGLSPCHFRIAVKSQAENEVLLAAIKEVIHG